MYKNRHIITKMGEIRVNLWHKRCVSVITRVQLFRSTDDSHWSISVVALWVSNISICKRDESKILCKYSKQLYSFTLKYYIALLHSTFYSGTVNFAWSNTPIFSHRGNPSDKQPLVVQYPTLPSFSFILSIHCYTIHCWWEKYSKNPYT